MEVEEDTLQSLSSSEPEDEADDEGEE